VILGLIFVGALMICHAALLYLVRTEEFAGEFLEIGAAFLFFASVSMAVNIVDLAAQEEEVRRGLRRVNVKLTLTVMLPFVLSAVLLNGGLWQWLGLSASRTLAWAGAGTALYFLAWGSVAVAAWIRRSVRTSQVKKSGRMVSIPALLIFSPIAGAAGASLLKGYNLLLGHLPPWTATNWIVVVFGTGMVMLAMLITGALHLGLVGRGSRDLVREWWARLGGYLMLVTLGWLLLAGTCAFGPLLVRWCIFEVSGSTSLAALLLWIANNYLGLRAAASAKTSGVQEKASGMRPEAGGTAVLQPGSGKAAQVVELLTSPRVLNLVAKVAPYIFAAGLILLFATAVHIGTGLVFDSADTKDLWQLSHGPKTADWHGLSDTYWSIQESASSSSLLGVGLLLILAGFLLSWRVDVNDFSLHHFYRNRLVRCYLGASNPDRSPQAFTGFDSHDDLPLTDFGGDYPGPYPILNAALNITGGEELGYATRRAKSFA
jgi:hypothetical protein